MERLKLLNSRNSARFVSIRWDAQANDSTRHPTAHTTLQVCAPVTERQTASSPRTKALIKGHRWDIARVRHLHRRANLTERSTRRSGNECGKQTISGGNRHAKSEFPTPADPRLLDNYPPPTSPIICPVENASSPCTAIGVDRRTGSPDSSARRTRRPLGLMFAVWRPGVGTPETGLNVEAEVFVPSGFGLSHWSLIVSPFDLSSAFEAMPCTDPHPAPHTAVLPRSAANPTLSLQSPHPHSFSSISGRFRLNVFIGKNKMPPEAHIVIGGESSSRGIALCGCHIRKNVNASSLPIYFRGAHRCPSPSSIHDLPSPIPANL
ncbi:hypothetical protein BDK51DRAFT_42219 [Blyttiomyces helicus]|uniref:Uncharacterized protein n=1 Tax=Blyttiomyces helicus TaxID=388810 RepID=A0A4P9WAB0_9FUNG|nr:hypothetical protein BDK51DRAFT_42219 [Blyttiomyces helicus]|eukprot:RKO87790.1 hypothetical protein BDK51DRAFT_42219 [Blyttiomyces helicus]